MSQVSCSTEFTPSERGVMDALIDLVALIDMPVGARVNARATRDGNGVNTHVSRPLMAAAFENALAVKGIADFALPRAETVQIFRDALEQSYMDVPHVAGLESALQSVSDAMRAHAVGIGVEEGQSFMATVTRDAGVVECTLTWPYRIQRTLTRPPIADEFPAAALRVLVQFPG